MSEWAAKVLEGVDKYTDIHTTDDLPVVFLDEVIAAIAKLGAGDGLVERAGRESDDLRHTVPLSMPYRCEIANTVTDLLARIAALTAQLAEKEEQLVSVLRREAATHERHDAKVARLEGALRHYRETLCEGFCGEDMWADEGHSHPEIQRDCGGCLAASVLLSAALTDGAADGGKHE